MREWEKMNKETRELLERANESLDVAYKNIRIAISDLRDSTFSEGLKKILTDIDKQKQEIEKLLNPVVSDVEIFRFTTDEKSWRFSEANH